MLIGANSKLVMIGDSITDAGRSRPAGEGLFDPYGKGYVSFVNALLGARYPELAIRVVNRGNSGNTVRDLKARWQEDVLELKPDWVSIMIGINDVWRQFDSPLMTEIQVLPEEYERTLTELVDQTLPRVKGLVLMAPYFIEAQRGDAMRRRMEEYAAIVHRLAVSRKTVFVDTQAAVDAYLEHFHSAQISWDRVHPNFTGHMVLARAFLQGVQFEW